MRRGTTMTAEKPMLNPFSLELQFQNMAIRTTLIAGYPGETEEDFAQTWKNG